MAAIVIPVWNVTNFIADESDTDFFGPFASADAAKEFVHTQVPEDTELDWKPTLPGEQSFSARVPGGRWRVMKSQMVLDSDGSPEFDAAILRASRQIMKTRFGLFTTDIQSGLYAAAQHIDEQISKDLPTGSPA